MRLTRLVTLADAVRATIYLHETNNSSMGITGPQALNDARQVDMPVAEDFIRRLHPSSRFGIYTEAHKGLC